MTATGDGRGVAGTDRYFDGLTTTGHGSDRAYHEMAQRPDAAQKPLSRLYRTIRPPIISDTADQQADGNDSETVRPLTSFSTEPLGEGRAA